MPAIGGGSRGMSGADYAKRLRKKKSKPKPKKSKNTGRVGSSSWKPSAGANSRGRSSGGVGRTSNPGAGAGAKKNYSSRRSSCRRSSGGGGGGNYTRSASNNKSSGGGGSKRRTTKASAPKEDPKPEKPKEPPPPKFKDWLGKDSLYNSQAGSGGTINTELDAYLASLAETQRQFEQDTGDALRNLGWKKGAPDEDVMGLANVTAAKGGAPQGYWDPTDELGAYGQSQTNARNDFSGRGLMDSSFYQDAVSNLDNSFNRQRNDYLSALQREENQYGQEKTSAQDKAGAARRAAKADALARYNATYNITP